jgi:hypothetical protein
MFPTEQKWEQFKFNSKYRKKFQAEFMKPNFQLAKCAVLWTYYEYLFYIILVKKLLCKYWLQVKFVRHILILDWCILLRYIVRNK